MSWPATSWLQKTITPVRDRLEILQVSWQPSGFSITMSLTTSTRCWLRRFGLTVTAFMGTLIGQLSWHCQVCSGSNNVSEQRVTYKKCSCLFNDQQLECRTLWQISYIFLNKGSHF